MWTQYRHIGAAPLFSAIQPYILRNMTIIPEETGKTPPEKSRYFKRHNKHFRDATGKNDGMLQQTTLHDT